MNRKEDLHPIFGEIDLEHAEMRKLLRSVHSILADRSRDASEVASVVDSFLAFLKQHFEHEDQGGGFFDQISEQTPRLSERADEVRHEHADLLDDFQALKHLADAKTADAAWWDQLNSRFQSISKELMHHERREEDLLQESFNEDIGTGD